MLHNFWNKYILNVEVLQTNFIKWYIYRDFTIVFGILIDVVVM